MAALTLDVLLRSLKKGARISEPVYLLYGDEDVLKDEAIWALIDSAVVLRGVEQLGKLKTKLRDEVVRYLGAPNPTTVLVLVVAAGEEPDPDLMRASASVEMETLAAERVPGWMQHRATTRGLALAADAAELLL